MFNEKLRMLLSDAEAVCGEAAAEIDWDDDDEYDGEAARLQQLSRELGDIVIRLRDVRLQVDRELEELR
jgi:hypothetical protein